MIKKEKILPPREQKVPCRPPWSGVRIYDPGAPPRHYNAFPRDCKYAFMSPATYAPGFRMLQLDKIDLDFTEMRSLMFLEDPNQANKWGTLKNRIPYPETRVTDLPGTRETHYYNYCVRSLIPESAAAWRNSIIKTKIEVSPAGEEEKQKEQHQQQQDKEGDVKEEEEC